MQTIKQTDQHNITQYGCAHTIKHAEQEQTKNLCHSFCNFLRIKNRNNIEEKAQPQESFIQKAHASIYTKHPRNSVSPDL